jgi:hypothetical protein
MHRSLLLIFLLLFNFIGFAQSDEIKGLISNAEFNVLYRGYNNHMELLTCQACDSVFVSAKNAVITMLEKRQL